MEAQGGLAGAQPSAVPPTTLGRAGSPGPGIPPPRRGARRSLEACGAASSCDAFSDASEGRALALRQSAEAWPAAHYISGSRPPSLLSDSKACANLPPPESGGPAGRKSTLSTAGERDSA